MTFCAVAFLAFLILYRIDPNFGAMVGARWNSQVETVEAFPALSEISGGARPYGGLNFGEKLVAIGIILLVHGDVAFSTGDIHALAGGVVIQIVRVLDSRKRPAQGNDKQVDWLSAFELLDSASPVISADRHPTPYLPGP